MSVLERCPSYRESNKGSKERQGPTLSVRFPEVSVFWRCPLRESRLYAFCSKHCFGIFNHGKVKTLRVSQLLWTSTYNCRFYLNNSTGHHGPPVFSPQCLVFIGCSLNVTYSFTLWAKWSTSIEWCSWGPFNPKCCVNNHHMVCKPKHFFFFARQCIRCVRSLLFAFVAKLFDRPCSTNFDWQN